MSNRHIPISPPAARGPRGGDLPAYLANGLIGLRVRENPLAAGMCIVSGFSGEHPERVVEASCPAPWPLGGDIAIADVWAADQPQALEPVDQALDFGTGELTTRLRFVRDGVTLDIEILTFCSRRHPAVVCQQLRVTASAACDFGWKARIDPSSARGGLKSRLTDTPGEDQPVCDGAVEWLSDGGLSTCGLALLTEAPDSAERTVDRWNRTGPIETEYRMRLRTGRPVVLRQIAALVPGVMHPQPHLHAVRLLARAGELGFERLRQENRACWADLWKSRIRLVGAEPRWQALADAGFYYLNSSVHGSSPSATSIFGLAAWPDYHYYFGHVMWDVDAFATPFLSLVQPDAAAALLDFRTRGLPAAADNAKLHGLRGLQFPWEAGPSAGHEATPGGASAAARELHVNMHVARAFTLHARATGDRRFREEKAWPVLSGVSDWLVDRAERGRSGYHLRDIGGPAETVETVDDDALTLMAGRDLLETATATAEALGRQTNPAWARVAQGLEPPMRSNGVVATYEDYRRTDEKAATPSVLMALFPYWRPLPEDVEQKTLRFYLEQWSDYVGAPMLAALYGVWAAWASDRALSLKLMDEGYGRYIHGRFDQTLEFRLDKVSDGVAAGPFVANTGGFLTGLLMGFPGLRIDDGDPALWPARPVILPEGWDAIECDRLHIHGRDWRLVARQGAERAELTPV